MEQPLLVSEKAAIGSSGHTSTFPRWELSIGPLNKGETVAKVNEIIRQLCDVALTGRIELEEFYESWPPDADDNEFYRQIFYDLEDLIEHSPGSLKTKEVDTVLMSRFHNYLAVFVDRMLLEYDFPADDMKKTRDHILKQKGLNIENAEKVVNAYMLTHYPSRT